MMPTFRELTDYADGSPGSTDRLLFETNAGEPRGVAPSTFATAAQGATADAALPRAGGTMTGALTLGSGASIDGAGKQVAHHLLAVVTGVSGTLTPTAHSGNVVKTSGNITVPTTTGFHCTVVAGGAHTITFNALTSPAMAAGDIVSLFVESATVIHAMKVLAANKVAFS